MSEQDGGPAFPFEYHNQTARHQKSFVTDHMLPPQASEQYPGMTLRDYAMVHMMAAWRHPANGLSSPKLVEYATADVDAMLKARDDHD